MTPKATIPSIIKELISTRFSPDSLARGDREHCVLHQACPELVAHHVLSALQPQAQMQNYILTYKTQRMLCQVVTMVIACREAHIILMLRRLRACEETILPVSKVKSSGTWIALGFTLWLTLPQWGGNIKYVESPFFPPRVCLCVLLTHRFHSLSSCPRTSGTYSSHTGLQIGVGQGIFQTYKVDMAEISMVKDDSVLLVEV